MASTLNAPMEEGLDAPSVDERRQLIDRVAASAQFRRSARLRDFLLYVGGQSLKEGCPEIHEQEIGTKVFGRSPSYDRSQDNIVRVNATELRKRIDLYFSTEGGHETLVLEIPRGGYKPVFHRRLPGNAPHPEIPTPIEVASEPPQQVAPPPAAEAPRRRAPVVWIGIAAVLAIACAVLLVQNLSLRSSSSAWAGRPEVESFWKDFAKGQPIIDIVLPDASVTLSEEITHKRMSLSDYLDHRYVNRDEQAALGPDRVDDLRSIFGHNLVMLGDFLAAQQILALTPLSSSLRLQHSRFYTAEAIKQNSFILIGGRKANPWMGLFDPQLNFSMDFDTEHGEYLALVTNRHPRAGEQAVYTPSGDANGFAGYSVIAYLPNPSRTGNVLILAGTDSAATRVAAEFLTSETSLAKFRSTLKVDRLPHFEVLLKTSRLSGTSFNAEMLAYRVYPD